MNEEDLKFYNMQDKEELVWMCISRDNRIKSLQQRIDKAITLLQLIQMNGEIDWGDINTLVNILRGEE